MRTTARRRSVAAVRAGVVSVALAIATAAPSAPGAGAGPAAGAGLVAGAGAVAAQETLVLGSSVAGRPIEAHVRRGAAPARHVAVIGVIHGDERAGRAVTDALLAAPVPDNLTLTVLPTMNPDGEAAGTRTNAHGVDLNRNFPFAWAPVDSGPFTSGTEHPGPYPLSEPESAAVARWLLATRPDLVVWYHQPWGAVVCDAASGPHCPALAAVIGLPTMVAPRPGSAAQWASANGMGTAVVELPERGSTAAEAAAQAAAILQRFAGVPGEPPLPTADLISGLGDAAALSLLDAPLRLVDTRAGGDPLVAGQRRRITVAGAPADATAVVATIAAVDPLGDGYLAVGPAGATSVLNFTASSPATSQHLPVPLSVGEDGRLGFDVVAVGAGAQVLVDVEGSWRRGTAGLRLDPEGPRRLLDTRDEGAPLQGERLVTVSGLAPGATAVELHLTALGQGWVSAWPGDRSWPGTSSLNLHHGISDGSVTVRLDASGSFRLASPLPAHVVVDVLGAYRSDGALRYRPLAAPVRVFDSRRQSGDRPATPLGWDETVTVALGTIPVGTGAVALNVTSVGGGGGWTVLWGAGARPWASLAQHVPGPYATAAASTVPNDGTAVHLASTAVGRHVVLDALGLYTAG